MALMCTQMLWQMAHGRRRRPRPSTLTAIMDQRIIRQCEGLLASTNLTAAGALNARGVFELVMHLVHIEQGLPDPYDATNSTKAFVKKTRFISSHTSTNITMPFTKMLVQVMEKVRYNLRDLPALCQNLQTDAHRMRWFGPGIAMRKESLVKHYDRKFISKLVSKVNGPLGLPSRPPDPAFDRETAFVMQKASGEIVQTAPAGGQAGWDFLDGLIAQQANGKGERKH